MNWEPSGAMAPEFVGAVSHETLLMICQSNGAVPVLRNSKRVSFVPAGKPSARDEIRAPGIENRIREQSSKLTTLWPAAPCGLNR